MNHLKKMKTTACSRFTTISYCRTRFQSPGPKLNVASVAPTSQVRTVILMVLLFTEGTSVAEWLSCCATNRKVAVSIPAGVSGFLIDIKSFRSHYGPEVDSASNRNEYQEYFLGVKAAGA